MVECGHEDPVSPLLSIRDLRVAFRTEAGPFEALHGLSLDVARGRTLALVGESGSGKSVTAQAILRILPRAAAITGGRILFEGQDLALLSPDGPEMRDLRGRRAAMIFQ